ncbi:MAG: SDR family oxidoreductase [Bryobacterales bacterium]|nr:SDR family oxidoreductase [Bryobacterales bacterium]
MGRLEGRQAVVTGGAKGLGAAFARAMAAEGAHCLIADIASAQSVVSQIRASGGKAAEIPTDVSDESAVRHLARVVEAELGGLDILVNNAALYASLEPVGCLDIDADLWDRVMAVNVRGSFLAAKHLAPLMAKRGGGKIINVSSGTAYKGQPTGMAHYIVSKGAILAMTRAFSRELGPLGICVNTLAPGLTLSDSILQNQPHIEMAEASVLASRALKRHGRPDDLIGAVLFLASSESDFVTGQTLAVDGGSINT